MAPVDLISHRLLSHRICGARLEQPEDVVQWMGAMQAQDYGQAVWAVGLRTPSAMLADVEQAIAAGKIVRTWPMRGTIHFVPAQDAKWMLRLSARRRLAADRRRQEQLQLNEEILERSGQIFYDALRGGGRLTRAEMLALLERSGISSADQRGYHILWYAALNGLICMGPMEGKQQTFLLLDEWVPDGRDLSRQEGLALLARRYFTSHGPATLRDFSWWTGLTLRDAKEAAESARPAIFSEIIEGKEYWLSGNSEETGEHQERNVILLPGYDEYLLGYTDRADILHSDHADKVVPGGNGVFRPLIVVNGRVVGTWQRVIKKKSIDIRLRPFSRLEVPEGSLEQAARRYCDFFGLPFSGIMVEEGLGDETGSHPPVHAS